MMRCTYDAARWRPPTASAGPRRKVKPMQAPLPFGRIVEAERLLATFQRLSQAGSAPGPDGVRWSDLSARAAAEICRDVAAAIRRQGYCPSARRVVSIPKANGGTRELSIRSLVHRVVACRVKDALEHYFDPRFAPWSVGFRPGLSTWHALATIDRGVRDGRTVFTQGDVVQAFPNLPLDRLVAVFADHLAERKTLALVEAILRGGEELERERGIDMGCPFSPLALNVYCDEAFDRRVTTAVDDPVRVRYADDVCVLARTVPEGAATLSEAAGLFEAAGLELKRDDPADLRDAQSLRTRPVGFLGFEIAATNGRLLLSVPEGAWTGLGEPVAEARTAADPAYAAHAAVKGWVQAYGPACGKARGERLCVRVRRTARGAGFREPARGCVERWASGAWGRWERLLREGRSRQPDLGRPARRRSSTPPVVEAVRGR